MRIEIIITRITNTIGKDKIVPTAPPKVEPKVVLEFKDGKCQCTFFGKVSPIMGMAARMQFIKGLRLHLSGKK